MDETIVLPLRRCKQCGGTKPASPEFFPVNRAYVGGLSSRCRPCKLFQAREQIARRKGLLPPRPPRTHKTCPRCRIAFPVESFAKTHSWCRSCSAEAARAKRRSHGAPERVTLTMKQRFWSKVDRRGPDECWPWRGGFFDSGYGQFHITKPRTSRGAHIVSWEYANGSLGNGLQVNHTCDQRFCVNPRHLYAGSQQQNMTDKVARNRQARGSGHGTAKIAEAQAREILVRANGGERGATIARAMGISRNTVYRCISRKNWKHVS